MLEIGAPDVLGLAEDGADKIDLRIVGIARSGDRRWARSTVCGSPPFNKLNKVDGVHPHEIPDDHDDDGTDADAGAAPADARSAVILDVIAAAAVVQFHELLLSKGHG